MISLAQQSALHKLRDDHPSHFMVKFCANAQDWLLEAHRIAAQLNLNAPPVKRILDVGTGFGYFQLACKRFGHDIVGLDVPDTFIQTAAAILGVSYIAHEIYAYQALPEDLMGYDVVTTFGVNFRHAQNQYWGWREYGFLARDVLGRLRPTGQWILRPNRANVEHLSFAYLFDEAAWRNALDGIDRATVERHGENIIIEKH